MFTAGWPTRYLQTKTLTKTARRTLPTSRKTRNGSNSSTSESPSCAGFSLASWLRSFMASSKRDKYWWRPRRGEPPASSDAFALWRSPPTSPSRDALRGWPKSGSGEPRLSGVAVWERAPGLGEGEDHGSDLSRSRWKRGSTERRPAAAESKTFRDNLTFFTFNGKKPQHFTRWKIIKAD